MSTADGAGAHPLAEQSGKHVEPDSQPADPLTSSTTTTAATAAADPNHSTTDRTTVADAPPEKPNTATPTTPVQTSSSAPANPSPLSQAATATPPPARTSFFFTPVKGTAATASPLPAASTNGHAAPGAALPSAVLPAISTQVSTSTPLTSRDKPPLPRPASTSLTAMSHPAQHSSKPKSGSLHFDPLLHPLQQKDAAQDDDSDGRDSTPSHSPSAAPPPLTTSMSATDLSVAASPNASPVSSPTHSSSTASSTTSMSSKTPLSRSGIAATPTSVSTSSSTPLAASSSSGGLSSWFSSFSSSSFSRDVALISTPPPLFDNYLGELSAFLHVLAQHPVPDLPENVSDVQEKLAGTTPSSSSIASALGDYDNRRKQAATYNASNGKKRVAKVQKMLQLNDGFIMDMKHLILKARRKCDTGHDALVAIVERLRVCFWMNEFNLLQEGMHLQDELFDNYEDMCKACIRQVKEKTKELQQLLEQLNTPATASTLPPLNEFFFLSPRQHAMLCPLLPDMLQRQSDLAARLAQVKVEYVAVAKVTEEEEKVSRNDRIVRVVDDFFSNYNGDLTADYSPARALEYDFTRCLMDERCKEGQALNKWITSIQQQARIQLTRGKDKPDRAERADKSEKERLSHSSILHFVRKFESNFVRDYGIAAARRLFVRLLIQRMLFPRIWDVCVMVEDAEAGTRDEDDKFVAQAEWLRCLSLDQLGVPAAFWMPEQVKAAVSSRWSKGRQGQQADSDDGVGSGGALPRELPTALQALLHLEEKKSEESVSTVSGGEGTSASAASMLAMNDGEDDDEFGRLFTKGSGGRKKKAAAGGNLFAKFDEDSKTPADNSPAISPSTSFASSPVKSTSSVPSATPIPTSTIPFELSTSQPESSIAAQDATQIPSKEVTEEKAQQTTTASSNSAAPVTEAQVVRPQPSANAQPDGLLVVAAAHSPSASSASPSAPINTATPATATTSSSTTATRPTTSTTALPPDAPLATRIAALKARHPPLPNRLRPYLSCIDCLEDITHLTCPLDMLQCLLAVVRNIYKTANEYAQLNCPPVEGKASPKLDSADVFFPILMYVLIQSDVKDMHRRLRFMKEYGLVKTEDLAEHKYYCTCVEGGVSFVMNAQPDEY